METREKLRNANLGKTHSIETRKKISESNKGRKLNVLQREDTTKRLKIESEKQCIMVNQYSLSGKYIFTYNSMSEAAIKTNSLVGNISSACSGKLHSSNDYIWRKYNNSIDDIDISGINIKWSKECKKIIMCEIYTEQNIIEFNSISMASKNTGILRTAINNALTGKSKSAGGYRWKYS